LSKKRHSRRLPVLAARNLKKSGRQTFVQKLLVESGCRMSQRRDDFAHSFSERSDMVVRLQLPRKKAPKPTDQHVGRRVRMRRMMLSMSQEKLGAALGLTFQQVQKYEKGTNRIGASRLQQMSHILQVPIAFFFEGAPNASAQHGSNRVSDLRNHSANPRRGPAHAAIAIRQNGRCV
jgi:transcriptional regulator with XRE-family HTH domain